MQFIYNTINEREYFVYDLSETHIHLYTYSEHNNFYFIMLWR